MGLKNLFVCRLFKISKNDTRQLLKNNFAATF